MGSPSPLSCRIIAKNLCRCPPCFLPRLHRSIPTVTLFFRLITHQRSMRTTRRTSTIKLTQVTAPLHSIRTTPRRQMQRMLISFRLSEILPSCLNLRLQFIAIDPSSALSEALKFDSFVQLNLFTEQTVSLIFLCQLLFNAE